jgi:hypothetical protein
MMLLSAHTSKLLDPIRLSLVTGHQAKPVAAGPMDAPPFGAVGGGGQVAVVSPNQIP